MFNLNEFLATEFSNLSLSYGDLAIIASYCEGKDLVVELGTCMGNTAKMMSYLSRRVMTFDLFEDMSGITDQSQLAMYQQQFIGRPHYFHNIKSYLRNYPNVEVMQGNTPDMTRFCHDNSIDVLFVDADHSYTGVKKDYEAWFIKVKPGGYFIFHDCCPDTTGVSQVWLYYQDTLIKDRRIEEDTPNVQIEENGTSIRVFRKIRN